MNERELVHKVAIAAFTPLGHEPSESELEGAQAAVVAVLHELAADPWFDSVIQADLRGMAKRASALA